MVQLLHVDSAIRSWIVLHRVPLFTEAMWGLSALGRFGIVWLLIAALLTTAHRLRRREWALLALALLVTSVLNDVVLKPMFARERPFVYSQDVAVIGSSPTTRSFPSGHTANAFAAAVVLSRFAAAPTFTWWVLALMMAYSRIYLGVHYPSDVAAGALVGAGVGAIVARTSRASVP